MTALIQQALLGVEIEAVKQLWAEYWEALGLSDEFQNFGEMLRSLPGDFAPPRGRLFLAKVENEWAGTAALKPISGDTCEMKRLFIRPEFRGLGVGAALLGAIINAAREIGYNQIYADTLPSMNAARKLYAGRGFHEVAPYSADPTPGAIYLAFSL